MCSVRNLACRRGVIPTDSRTLGDVFGPEPNNEYGPFSKNSRTLGDVFGPELTRRDRDRRVDSRTLGDVFGPEPVGY